jgi:hypothetical protein
VGLAQPRSAGAGRVQSVTADQSQGRVRQVLQELGDEIRGTEGLAVGTEVGVIGRVVQHRACMVFDNQLASGKPAPGRCIGKGPRGFSKSRRGCARSASTLKPEWSHCSMLRASRWLISSRLRNKSTMEARKYWLSLARSSRGVCTNRPERSKPPCSTMACRCGLIGLRPPRRAF